MRSGAGLTRRIVVAIPTLALSAAPSAWPTITAGMPNLRSRHRPCTNGAPATLLATIIPAAPAAFTLAALTTKSQVPRSTTTKLPAATGATVSQASAVAPVPSLAMASGPVAPATVSGALNSATGALYELAPWTTWLVPGTLQRYICMRPEVPSLRRGEVGVVRAAAVLRLREHRVAGSAAEAEVVHPGSCPRPR